ncbi:hypothetical protein B0H12DRAFT_608663 [Mycena haematopus]|nr:hypothetical protein B0H12DRAFT_608663 [Mycena haematopus]
MSEPDGASSEDPDGQVEPADGANDPDANDVIDEGDRNIHEAKESRPKVTPPNTPLSMPNLADLTLHSPSSIIVGTPFSDAHSARFEYPFPAERASSFPSPELATHTPPQTSPTFSSISSSPSSSVLVSASQPQLVLNAPPDPAAFRRLIPPSRACKLLPDPSQNARSRSARAPRARKEAPALHPRPQPREALAQTQPARRECPEPRCRHGSSADDQRAASRSQLGSRSESNSAPCARSPGNRQWNRRYRQIHLSRSFTFFDSFGFYGVLFILGLMPHSFTSQPHTRIQVSSLFSTYVLTW